MTRIRILGVGSPHGDDRVGWRVVQALQEGGALARMSCAASAIALDRPGPDLINHFAGADVVVVIDAVKSGRPPGTIHRIDDVAHLPDERTLSSHGFGLAPTLALARALGAMPARLVLYGIEIANGVCGDAIDDRVDAVAATIEGELKALAERTVGSRS